MASLIRPRAQSLFLLKVYYVYNRYYENVIVKPFILLKILALKKKQFTKNRTEQMEGKVGKGRKKTLNKGKQSKNRNTK